MIPVADQYQWTSPKPLGRDDPVEQGDVFEPTYAERQAFGDLIEPVDEDEESDGEHFHMLDPSEYTIGGLEEALETGDFDDVLDDIEALETDGKDRDGARDVIEARREEI